MSTAVLTHIADKMQAMGLPYSLARWEGATATENTYYFVGEYAETETPDRAESGRQETMLILRGFTRGKWLLLEQAKAKIESGLPGTLVLDDGTGVAIMYDYGMIVPTADASLKSIKINLTIQEWRVR